MDMRLKQLSWVALQCAMMVNTIPARADTVVTLLGVTLSDGAVATGSFTLNVYGYLEAASVTTTAGITDSIPAETYNQLPGYIPSDASNGFDSLLLLNSADGDWSLDLQTVSPIVLFPGDTDLGVVPLQLVTSGNGYPPSGEYCVTGPATCGGLSYLQGTLAASGSLDAPEPASLTLLAVGGAMLPLLRRQRARAARRA